MHDRFGMSNITTENNHRRIALLVEYDGTAYNGFQYQKNAPSVQGVLESAIWSLTGEKARIKSAGRTDTGVHATGQVVCLDTYSNHSVQIFKQALNHYLPEDISIRDASEVSPDFDPRRSAQSREYVYKILNAKTASPILRQFVHLVKRDLHLELMKEASASLLGIIDCSPFSGPLGSRKSAVRTIYRCDVSAERNFIIVSMKASGFLHQQVRRTVGSLIEVGLGNLTVDKFKSLTGLGAARWVAPAKGLFLVKVNYHDNLFNKSSITNEHNVKEVGTLI